MKRCLDIVLVLWCTLWLWLSGGIFFASWQWEKVWPEAIGKVPPAALIVIAIMAVLLMLSWVIAQIILQIKLLKYFFPGLKKWHTVLLSIASVILFPLMVMAVNAVAAFKRGSRKAIVLFIIYFCLSVCLSFCKKLPDTAVTIAVGVYGSFLSALILPLLTVAVVPEKPSRKVSLFAWLSFAVCILLFAGSIGMTVLADMRNLHSGSRLSALNAPCNRAQYDSFVNNGKAPTESGRRFIELAKQIEQATRKSQWDLPVALPVCQALLTPDIRNERRSYLQKADKLFAEQDKLLDTEIVFPYAPEKPLINRLMPEYQAVRQMVRTYAMQIQEALDNSQPDKTKALALFHRSAKARDLLIRRPMIGTLVWSAAEAIRLSALDDILIHGPELTRPELEEILKSLDRDERLIHKVFANTPRAEAMFGIDTINVLMNNPELFGIKELPPIASFRYTFPAFYVMAAESRHFVAEYTADFIEEIADSDKEYWQLPATKKYESYIGNKGPLTGMIHPSSVWRQIQLRKYQTLVNIRATRYMVQKKMGQNPPLPRDPFADAPLKMEKGIFKLYSTGDKVYGTRFISVNKRNEKYHTTAEFPIRKAE